MSKKTLVLLSCLVLSLTLGLGGSLAYLTDTAEQVNTFTMGGVNIELNEEFQQGAALKPGAIIPKKPTIKNIGTNAAWVWLTWEIPSELDVWNPTGIAGADKNVIHWNFLAATSADYLNDEYWLNKAIKDGYLPVETTTEQISTSKTYWTYFPTPDAKKTVDGIQYNVYVIKYNKALTPEEETLPSVVKVYLDSRVDIAADGSLSFVEDGQKTPINWNINTNGAPKIIVNAYAIQAEGFENVEQAYAAYNAQWEAEKSSDAESNGEDVEANDNTSYDGPVDGDNVENDGAIDTPEVAEGEVVDMDNESTTVTE